MDEQRKFLKELDRKVYEIIDNASDREKASQALDYYLNGKGSVLSLIELGISEVISKQNLSIYKTLEDVFSYECKVNFPGDYSLTKFCIMSGILSQFFDVKESSKRKYKHLYVILLSNNTVKIGIAHDVDKRYSQIKASSGMEIVKHWESELIENAYLLETDLHRRYKAKRLHGEYFSIDYDEAVNQAKMIIAELIFEDHIDVRGNQYGGSITD